MKKARWSYHRGLFGSAFPFNFFDFCHGSGIPRNFEVRRNVGWHDPHLSVLSELNHPTLLKSYRQKRPLIIDISFSPFSLWAENNDRRSLFCGDLEFTLGNATSHGFLLLRANKNGAAESSAGCSETPQQLFSTKF